MIERYVSPDEFKRLISALLGVLGFIAIAAVFAFLVLPGLRYQAHTSDESTIQAVQGDSGWLDPTEYLPSARQEIPPLDPKTILEPTPELLTRGKLLYTQNCTSCHGDAGRGDGPGGRGLNPAPRNFGVGAGWKNGSHIEGIYRTLEEGIKNSSMVSYTYLPRRDRMALVHFVRTLGSFEHQPSDPQARAALEKTFVSSGEVIPNKIPVSQAIRRLTDEYQSPTLPGQCAHQSFAQAFEDPERAARTISALEAGKADPGAFTQPIVAGAETNGFAARVATFSASQWNQLRLCIASH